MSHFLSLAAFITGAPARDQLLFAVVGTLTIIPVVCVSIRVCVFHVYFSTSLAPLTAGNTQIYGTFSECSYKLTLIHFWLT